MPPHIIADIITYRQSMEERGVFSCKSYLALCRPYSYATIPDTNPFGSWPHLLHGYVFNRVKCLFLSAYKLAFINLFQWKETFTGFQESCHFTNFRKTSILLLILQFEIWWLPYRKGVAAQPDKGNRAVLPSASLLFFFLSSLFQYSNSLIISIRCLYWANKTRSKFRC